MAVRNRLTAVAGSGEPGLSASLSRKYAETAPPAQSISVAVSASDTHSAPRLPLGAGGGGTCQGCCGPDQIGSAGASTAPVADGDCQAGLSGGWVCHSPGASCRACQGAITWVRSGVTTGIVAVGASA